MTQILSKQGRCKEGLERTGSLSGFRSPSFSSAKAPLRLGFLASDQRQRPFDGGLRIKIRAARHRGRKRGATLLAGEAALRGWKGIGKWGEGVAEFNHGSICGSCSMTTSS